MAGITYKKNRFFIQTTSDKIFLDKSFDGERISMLVRFAGSLVEEKDVQEQIDLSHELNHIIQDLSIPACIVEADFKDTIRGYLTNMSKIKGIRFPFIDEDNRRWNMSITQISDEEKKVIKTVYYLYEIYSFLFLKSFYKPETPEFKIYSENERSFYYDISNISVTDLLETYALHKSYWEQYLCDSNSDDRNNLLHRLTKKANLYPYHIVDEKIEIDSRLLKLAKPYEIVQAMLMLVYCFDIKKLVDYYENDIPNHYTTSEAYLMMRLMMSVLETSLCIPSMDTILARISPETALQFSPVHRFYRILKNIYESDNMPDLVEGEDYFITFHNWIAAKNGWMDYNSTMASVFSSLYSRAEIGKEVITNYQMTALNYKFEHLTTSTFVFPIEIFRIVNMPLMVKVSDKLVSLFFLGTHTLNETRILSLYNLYFNPMDLDFNEGIVKYKTISEEIPYDECLKRIQNNATGAKREIAIRMLAYETLQAFASRGHFSCPMRDGLCPHGCDKCSSFKSFRDIVPICNKRIYRGPTKKEMRDDNTGNSIDCMLFDYLLDYGFNPLALE